MSEDRDTASAWHTSERLQAHLAAIVATSDDAIISKDLNGIIRSWNAAAARIFGWTPEEIIGKSILAIIPPDRYNEETKILEQLRRGQRIDHFQTIRMAKDGRLIEISVTVSPIKDSTGKVIGASKIARDTTEWNRASREREGLYELGKALAGEMDIAAIVQQITDLATASCGAEFGAFFYEVRGTKGEAYTLYAVSGLPREKFATLPMPRNSELFKLTFGGEAVIRSTDITRDPRYGRSARHHGQPICPLPVHSYLAVPVMSRGGHVLGGLFFGHSRRGMFTDQHERAVVAIAGHATVALDNARLHRELSETAQRFQQLANTIPQLAWMTKPDGTMYWFNDRWLKYTGGNADDKSDRAWELAVEPTELARVKERWKQAVTAGVPWEDTFPLRRFDGVYRWHLSRAVPLRDGNGNIMSWFGTNTDVTDQMNLAHDRDQLLEAERAARSEAERVSRMKDEFLATLSHELRTPLNAILGWSQIIQQGRQDAETVDEGLTVIERNARAQTQLIEDLLDMSRIISGKIRLDVQGVDLAAVVDAAANSIKPAADAKGVSLVKVVDPLCGRVSGDPNRLQQIAWNLLSNAVKFTPKRGKVEILLRRVDSHAEITVTDTGQGIKLEFLPHVFERFRQADSSTTRQSGGLGLGLAIVKHLVELHGGQVRVSSDGEGQGASFTVALPLAVTRHEELKGQQREATKSTALMDRRRIILEQLKVLIVEDEPDARHLISRVLSDAGAQVFAAESADEGMRKLRQHRPDILISDIGMPQKDGYMFMREVRSLAEDEGGKTPAIALTAFARSDDRTRAMIAGYQVHMSKPIEPIELVATAASLVGRTGKDT